MKLYFAGSITGGREDKALYADIIKLLSNYGQVLTEHLGDQNLTKIGEEKLSSEYIYDRDLNWLKESDVVIAEVSTPSLGVGYEIAKAEEFGKKILCLFRETEGKRLSAMIAGGKTSTVKTYKSIKDMSKILDMYFKNLI